jgi:lipoprotein-releasing system permease protein
VRISIVSISLAIIVNLVTLAVVTGFKQEIREKITGFGSHFFIKTAGESSPYETDPILKSHPAIEQLKAIENLSGLYAVVYKPALIQSKGVDKRIKLSSGKDSILTKQDVLGVIFKGFSTPQHWDFFRNNLIEGKIPDFSKSNDIEPIIISQKTASLLNYKLKDTVDAFFVKQSPVKRQFVIEGIYSTGLEEFDQKIALTNLPIVQELNDWGLNSVIRVSDTLSQGKLIISAEISGGDGSYQYDWGEGFQRYEGFLLCPQADTTIRLITKSISVAVGKKDRVLIDTSFIKLTVHNSPNCEYIINENGEVAKEYLDQIGNRYKIKTSNKGYIEVTHQDGKSTSLNYVSGFEVALQNWGDLDEKSGELKKLVELVPDDSGDLLEVNSIKDTEKELFLWLGFLDINVLIIIVLMLLIGIINMGSAMLVLIVVRTNFIGMMKAIGASNWTIRKVFLVQAGFLILRGMFWGNLIGVGFCLLQKYTGVISLNPEVYYLSQVPIELDIWHVLLLNCGTLLVCLLALVIPSYVITRINPVKAIRFD